ncbi:MAG: amino acid adenylation domain-containing protein [Selenomonadaceae bacterium]|nr:amino acid adenylation domain-containing protein [Selenomonadaceae bacterium]
MFYDAVKKFPNNTAVIFKDKKFSYIEVDRISNDIAAYILSKNIGKGDVVSILIPRDEFMALAPLGALKAGCAYQPLDPTYPPERLNFMIKDSAAKILITTKKLRNLITDFDGEILLTDEIPSAENFKPQYVNSPEDIFVLLYTSGSTGVPKGVRLTHSNLVCNINWHNRYYDLQPENRSALYAGFGFDMHMFDLYSSLTCGASIYILPDEIRLDLDGMNKYFEKNNITHAFMTTQVGHQFASYVENNSLKHLTVAGEKLVTLKPPKNFILHNGYGPSETTMLISIFKVDGVYKNIPIGKPLDNVKLYIVDANGHRVPVGALGELWAAGSQVGVGYLNRPEKTAEVFIKNPFDGGEYSRAYRTGDIVRYRADGNIEFIGRRDGQVKIRGFRIELSEVEAVIREFPKIKDATVSAFDNPSGGKFVAAYVVSDEKISVEELNKFIAERKPPYMIPAVTTQIEKIPLNPNGKVNRRVLPKPEFKHSEKNEIAAPLNILEKDLKNIAAEILGTENFGITDIFGELGLTSISAIRLATKIYKKYDVQIQARNLVSNGTIQTVENEILQKFLSSEITTEIEVAKPAEKFSCPLTFAQQGVYAECQANPDSTIYNVPFYLKFPAEITATELEKAVHIVVDAHPYISSRFTVNKNNDIVQEPIPKFALEIPILEMNSDDFVAYREKFVRPFKLDAEPLIRFEIVQADSLYLLMDIHHLISDGVSVNIFLNQLCDVLDGKEIEAETYSYYDYARDEKIKPDTEKFFASRMALSEDSTQLLPDVYDENLEHNESNVEVSINFAEVKDFAKKFGVTPASVCLAASYIVFSKFVYEDTVTIATISNGRSNLKINNTMGMFVNTLPLVETVDNKEKISDFIQRVAKNFADTIAHENYPFAQIASKYDFHPNVSFTYQIGITEEFKIKSGIVEIKDFELNKAKIPVGIYIVGTEENAKIKVNYDTALYRREMMKLLAVCYKNVLEDLITKDTISEISLTDKNEWQILDSYNRTWDLNFDKNDTAVSIFKRNAATYPDKIAAVYCDKSYTYRELDELTDKLAAKIYKKMCTVTGKTNLAEEIISIIIPRNENVFILPLAVLKTGCAYEPLDPAYPPERLNFMVKDAGAKLLLADDSLCNVVDEYKGEVLTLKELYSAADENLELPNPSPENLLIVLYTSGSTGMPKGCQIEHRNLVAYAHGIEKMNFYTKDDKIAAYASFGFDVNMSDVFCTLLNGGTVHLVPDEVRMNLDALADYFDKVGITALVLTTQVGVQFLQNYPNPKTLKMLVMGGEKLPPVNPSGLSYTIVNGYGPTENCCGVSMFPIKEWEKNIPIGRPFSTINAYVLDKAGHRLPSGAAGEFCLSGPQVARGYLNRPDKTAEVFENCPFNDFRMYHTGDIVRYRQNGDVEFVGRKDGQVKIRGFRIETKEVEAVIRTFENIKDVTVQAYDYESGGKYLAAFFTSDKQIDIAALTNFIKSQKPAYMVPVAYMQIDKIPLTINQKVDKKALPKPNLQRAEYVAPANNQEEDFCNIFAEVLGLEKVSAEDDFFEIGGSSILAMKVIILAGKKGYGIVYNDVFSNTTPRQLAKFVGAETEQNIAVIDSDDLMQITEIGSDGYDYSAINKLLAKNTMETFTGGERQNLGDVLLAGATGYLGIHVFREILTSTDLKIYCLVRAKGNENGEQRLKLLLAHYFGKNYAELFGSRIFVIEGDVTDSQTLNNFVPTSEMTVINCAASVKHFAKNNEIERTNVNSVKTLVSWCKKNFARLVHISTGSIIGSRKNGMPPKNYQFNENVLFAGQSIDDNQYIHSKFMAERIIYEAILKDGLNAKVLRVGNLAPRVSDGKFQINFKTNNIMNTFRAYKILGKVSFEILAQEMEFSPIDSLAKAVLALASTPKDCVCFMPMNPHRALIQDVIGEIQQAGYAMKIVSQQEMTETLQEALSEGKKSDALVPLMAYAKNSGTEGLGLDAVNTNYTLQVLYRLGFQWSETGSLYIKQFITKLKELDFFEE